MWPHQHQQLTNRLFRTTRHALIATEYKQNDTQDCRETHKKKNMAIIHSQLRTRRRRGGVRWRSVRRRRPLRATRHPKGGTGSRQWRRRPPLMPPPPPPPVASPYDGTTKQTHRCSCTNRGRGKREHMRAYVFSFRIPDPCVCVSHHVSGVCRTAAPA